MWRRRRRAAAAAAAAAGGSACGGGGGAGAGGAASPPTMMLRDLEEGRGGGEGGESGDDAAAAAGTAAEVVAAKLSRVERALQGVVVEMARQAVRATDEARAWETDKFLRDHGLCLHSDGDGDGGRGRRGPSSRRPSSSRWSGLQPAVPIAARHAREAAEMVAEAEERAETALVHRRAAAHRLTLALPTIALALLLAVGGLACTALGLAVYPGGDLPVPWFLGVVVSLLIGEPLLHAAAHHRRIRREDAARARSRAAYAQEAEEERQAVWAHEHARLVARVGLSAAIAIERDDPAALGRRRQRRRRHRRGRRRRRSR